jgi:hypothetical protein
MQPADNGRKRHDEDLIAEIVADVQDPVAPVFGALRHDERAHDASGLITHISQIADGGAGLIDQDALTVGAMEIDLTHVPPLPKANR